MAAKPKPTSAWSDTGNMKKYVIDSERGFSSNNSNNSVTRNVSLIEKLLLPLWKLTCYSGILLDWCRPIPRNRCFSFINYTATVAISFLIVSLAAFYTIQIVIALTNMTNVYSIVPNVIWFTAFLQASFTLVYFTLKRHQMLSLFAKWNAFELRLNVNVLNIGVYRSSKRVAAFMFVVYFLMTCYNSYSHSLKMLTKPEAPILLSHYEFLRQALSFDLIFVIHLIAGFYKWILITLSDVVPGIVFYYAAATLRFIELLLKDDFEALIRRPHLIKSVADEMSDSNELAPAVPEFKSPFCLRLRRTWSKYETFVDLVKQTNDIFGSLMFLDHGIKFFLICTVFAQFLSSFTDPNIHMLAPMSASFTFIFRYAASILLAAELHHTSSATNESALSLYSLNCFHMSKDEREIFNLFINRLKESSLAARPLDLYSIDKGILLAIVSLTISYVIVVVQMHPSV